MDFELIEHALPILLLGAGVTIEITAVSVAIGFFIGLFVGIARISQMKILRILATITLTASEELLCWCKSSLYILHCQLLQGTELNLLQLPLLPAVLTAVLMFLKFSEQESSQSISVRPKQEDLWD